MRKRTFLAILTVVLTVSSAHAEEEKQGFFKKFLGGKEAKAAPAPDPEIARALSIPAAPRPVAPRLPQAINRPMDPMPSYAKPPQFDLRQPKLVQPRIVQPKIVSPQPSKVQAQLKSVRQFDRYGRAQIGEESTA